MSNIIRVFPRATSYTPTDGMAFVGEPPMLRPAQEDVEEIHVSNTFIWDYVESCRLLKSWRSQYPQAIMRIGGPVWNSPVDTFTPGLYVRQGVTFTSRGCPMACEWCLVPGREGKLQIYDPIPAGHIIQDNNFLSCPGSHRQKVYAMLAQQPRAAVFAGGLQPGRVTTRVADELRGVRIACAFLAADTAESLQALRRAVERLSWLGRKKLRCYMLLGYGDDTLQKAEARLETAWEMGVLPFAQLYRPAEGEIDYSPEWRALAKAWSRPAAMVAMHKKAL